MDYARFIKRLLRFILYLNPFFLLKIQTKKIAKCLVSKTYEATSDQFTLAVFCTFSLEKVSQNGAFLLVQIWTLFSQQKSKISIKDLFSECDQFFYIYPDFFSRTFTIHRTAGEKGGYIFNSSLLLPLASQTLRHQPDDYCRELTFAHSQQPDSNREPLVSERKSLTTKLCYQTRSFL